MSEAGASNGNRGGQPERRQEGRKSPTETPAPTVQRGKEGKSPLPTPRTMKKTTCQQKQVATPGTTWKEPPAQKHTSSGTTGVAKVKRDNGAIPSYCQGETRKSEPNAINGAAQLGPIRTPGGRVAQRPRTDGPNLPDGMGQKRHKSGKKDTP